MRFSVCMMAYNSENTISEAIDSVVRQSFNDFELIIVDNGSSDNTREIVKQYGDKRIKLLEGQNKGLLWSRIQAIECAQGEYIITVDSDDKLVENAFIIINEAINKSGADLIHYRGIQVFPDGRKVAMPILLEDEIVYGSAKIEEIFISLITKENYTTLWNKAVKRECISIDEMKKCPKVNVGEDNIIQMFTVPNLKSYYYINDELYLYSAVGGITKRFLMDSYQNHKNRIIAKKYAIDCAGLDSSLYEEDLAIMSIETVAKICAYFPTKLEKQEREQYYLCLEEIRSDSWFEDKYCFYRKSIEMIYKIPLFLLWHRRYKIMYTYKKICLLLRKLFW